mmetsp:Transcript_53088/g.146989  ORF Transcript_53088/g.146989 Transcript_53088/m.146989 type:complete len:148 (-) Transcript_53088:131-574(-)
MGQGGGAKKKKKKEEAAVYGLYGQLCAAALSIAGIAVFLVGLNSGISRLQQSAYYPRPSIYWGSFVAIFAAFLQVLALPFACSRRYAYVKRETEDDMDDGMGAGQYYGPPDIGLPPTALGAGGGYGDGYGGGCGGGYGGGYGGYPPY